MEVSSKIISETLNPVFDSIPFDKETSIDFCWNVISLIYDRIEPVGVART